MVAAWAVAGLILFACYWRLSWTALVNSDGAGNALQAWDMLHGNLLLHGWKLSDVSFYTTELPEYMLVELALGLSANVVHVAAAATYTLVMVLAALLAKGSATGRAGLIRAAIAAGIMLAPQLGDGVYTQLLSPDHVGTAAPVLVAWLILDRARPRWYVPAIVAALLALALVADTLILYIAIVPLALVGAIRAYQGVVAAAAAVVLAVVRALAGRGGGGLGGRRRGCWPPRCAPRAATRCSRWRPTSPILPRWPATPGCGCETILVLFGADFLGRPFGSVTRDGARPPGRGGPGRLGALGRAPAGSSVTAIWFPRSWSRPWSSTWPRSC